MSIKIRSQFFKNLKYFAAGIQSCFLTNSKKIFGQNPKKIYEK